MAATIVKTACPHDCPRLTAEGQVEIGNGRGRLTLKVRPFAGVQRGVVIVEGVWPNRDFAGALGINQLIGADRVPPMAAAPSMTRRFG